MTSIERRGFTLIEVVITMAIVAILAAIAFPSYRKSVQKSNRSAAKATLTQILSREESFYGDRKAYATTLSALGYASDPIYLDKDGTQNTTTSDDRAYTVRVCTAAPCAAATANLVWFSAAPTNIQSNDDCGTLYINTAGAKSQSGSGVNCWKN